uniref:Uncharacterized protein n=1 Tax=Malurus cyaneus samueli TaxID=2593467 RepID=A0A8C5T826_9PASS
MLCNYSAVPDTPEMERIRSTQKNISSVSNSEEIQRATTISDPPELRRVKENQKNISNVQYKEQLCKATPVSVTPEMERVKRNQENEILTNLFFFTFLFNSNLCSFTCLLVRQ